MKLTHVMDLNIIPSDEDFMLSGKSITFITEGTVLRLIGPGGNAEYELDKVKSLIIRKRD